ncbi:hypothetical protein [Allocoleopsis franciscana]|nr:hypothetical protein [Allocoleopsis franciscana]
MSEEGIKRFRGHSGMNIKKLILLVTLLSISAIVGTPSSLKAEPLRNRTPEVGEQQATNFIPNQPLIQLVKGSGPEVFLIQDGERRWITDSKTFDAYGFNYSDVKEIFDEELSSYPEGTPITKNGTILKGSNSGNVYIIINGNRRLMSTRVFEKYQVQSEDIHSVTDSYLLSIPEESALR